MRYHLPFVKLGIKSKRNKSMCIMSSGDESHGEKIKQSEGPKGVLGRGRG